MSSEPTPVDKCPHCSGSLNVSLFARAAKESSISMVIKTKEGEFLGVDTLGGVLTSLSRLLKSSGKELGMKTDSFIRDLSLIDGEIRVSVLIARTEK